MNRRRQLRIIDEGGRMMRISDVLKMMTLTTDCAVRSQVRRRWRLTVLAGLLAGVAACNSTPHTEQMAHCSHVYGTWLRYLQSAMDQSGERARAEKTLFDCQHSNYDTDDLAAIVQNRGFPPTLVAGT